VFLVFAAPARAGGPSMVLGANEGALVQKTFVGAKANLSLAKLAGFRAIKVTEFWWPGLTEPRDFDKTTLGNVEKAAGMLGLPIYLQITNTLGRYAPISDEDRADFVQFAAQTARTFPGFKRIGIGNEPNLNMFWAPQFDVDGSDIAARTYESVLADSYDALKAVSPKIMVIGGAVSPRGHDDPNFSSKSHSPTTFIRDLGDAYKASGRTKPIMDWFGFHPYGANSSELPTTRHETSTSITLADYSKLIRVLGQAFDGTGQVGSKIPIVYDEYGIESTIPRNKRNKYTGVEPKSTKPVPPATQGQRYKQAIALAFCQPTIKAMFLFHAFDETDLNRWQSGLFYADHTAKPSLAIVRQAFQEVRRGVIAHCPGMRLRVIAKIKFPNPSAAASAAKHGSALKLNVHCSIDCRYTVGVVDVHTGRSVITAVGQAVGGKNKLVRMPGRKLGRGRYRFLISLVAPVNPGRVSQQRSASFGVR
jgi:hypothetical protein